MTEPANDFRYTDLNDVDPNFSLLEPEVYTLRISKAELLTFKAKTAQPAKGINVGDEGTYIKFTFIVTNHPKSAGQRHWETFFSSPFALRNLRRIADASGVPQAGSMENWLSSLSTIQPSIKLKIDKVDDVVRVKNASGEYDEVPNPRTVNSDGTPSKKNTVDWRAGVMQAE